MHGDLKKDTSEKGYALYKGRELVFNSFQMFSNGMLLLKITQGKAIKIPKPKQHFSYYQ